MSDSAIVNKIREIRAMTVAELREEWLRLYGGPTRSRNRDYLWKRLSWRVQELALGGLSNAARERLRELGRSSLEFVRARRPDGFNPEAIVAGSDGQKPAPKTTPDRRLPRPGTTLTRRYRDREIRVVILADGFEWDGRRFGSLSEVARAVTGQHWNGRLFFGLTERKRRR